MGLQADLIGAHALGIRNILALTGDPPNLGDNRESTPVYDVDSIGLVRIINAFNQGVDISGREMGKRAQFTIAVTSDAFVTLTLEGRDGLTVTIPANQTMSQRVYLTAGPGTRAAVSDRTAVRIWVEELGTTNRVSQDTIFNGKEN